MLKSLNNSVSFANRISPTSYWLLHWPLVSFRAEQGLLLLLFCLQFRVRKIVGTKSRGFLKWRALMWWIRVGWGNQPPNSHQERLFFFFVFFFLVPFLSTVGLNGVVSHFNCWRIDRLSSISNVAAAYSHQSMDNTTVERSIHPSIHPFSPYIF